MSSASLLLISSGPEWSARWLHHRLLQRGFESHWLILCDQLQTRQQLNPQGFPQIYPAPQGQPEKVHRLIKTLGLPAQFSLAFGSQAFAYSPPEAAWKMLYCQRVEQADLWQPSSQQQLQQILDRWQGFTAPRVGRECAALYAARLIFTSSEPVGQVLGRLYPRLTGKIHQPALSFRELARAEAEHLQVTPLAFEQRPFDVMLASSNPGPELSPALQGLRRAPYDPTQPLQHYQQLAQTRCVVCPAGFRWQSLAVEQAEAMGCNTLPEFAPGQDLCSLLREQRPLSPQIDPAQELGEIVEALRA